MTASQFLQEKMFCLEWHWRKRFLAQTAIQFEKVLPWPFDLVLE
jgi:hypothetical protein